MKMLALSKNKNVFLKLSPNKLEFLTLGGAIPLLNLEVDPMYYLSYPNKLVKDQEN